MSLEELQAGRCIAHVDLDGEHPYLAYELLYLLQGSKTRVLKRLVYTRLY